MKIKMKILSVFMLLMCLVVCPMSTEAESSLVEITVEFGNDGNIVKGKNTPVEVTINNLGGDFSGYVGVTLATNYCEIVSFEKEFSIAGNSQKTITVIIPSECDITYTSGLKVSVVNNKGTVLKTKTINDVYAYMNDQLIIGTLTDDYNSISYFDGVEVDFRDTYIKTSLKEYSQSTFPTDSAVLSLCDYLIIDNFNTSSLSPEQLEALETWINSGGSLIIGTGANYNKVLSGLDIGIYGIEANTSSKQEIYNYDISEYVSLECALLQLESAYYQMYIEGAYNKDSGSGLIVVLNYSLGDAKGNMETESLIYEAMSYKLISKYDMNTSYYGYSIYSNMKSGLSKIIDIELPKGSGYSVLFAFYCIIFIPGLYLILKLINKREIIMPCIIGVSVVFIVIVICMSLKYVINEPIYSSYNIMYADGKNTNVDSYFICLNPDANDISIKFDESVSSVTPVYKEYSYYSYVDSMDLDKEPAFRIQEGNGGYVASYKPDKAFDSNCFKATVTDKAIDGFDINIHDTDSVKGSVVNNTGITLDAVVVYYNGASIAVKNVEPGEVITFNEYDMNSGTNDILVSAISYEFSYNSEIYSFADNINDKLIVPENAVVVFGLTDDFNINYIQGAKDSNSWTCFYDYNMLNKE